MILQRMRALVVSANSDILSSGDQANIQAELDTLAKQINTVAQDTTFNGIQLLDGSLPLIRLYEVECPALAASGQR